MLDGLLLDMLSEVVRDENITSEVSTLYCVKVMVKRVRSFVYIFVRVRSGGGVGERFQGYILLIFPRQPD